MLPKGFIFVQFLSLLKQSMTKTNTFIYIYILKITHKNILHTQRTFQGKQSSIFCFFYECKKKNEK